MFPGWAETGEEAKKIESGEVKKSCPNCKDGKVILRGSIYGKFYGCSNYPKCKFIQKRAEKEFGKASAQNR